MLIFDVHPTSVSARSAPVVNNFEIIFFLSPWRSVHKIFGRKMRWFLLIILVTRCPNCLTAACNGCLDGGKLLELQKQLEFLTNEVKVLRENSEGM